MRLTTRFIIFTAMIILSVVSMYTTYASLHDSILPEPSVAIPLWAGHVWNCSVFALALSVAIGLMLFGLKIAIIDEQKRLSILGLIGLIFVGFISITFNIDVLYRTADRDFFVRYENDQMRSVYENYLAQVQTALEDKKTGLLRQVAEQEGELESEIKGLRQAPAGYGERARHEDYRLTVLKKTTDVDMQLVDNALESKKKVDQMLANAETPTTLDQVMDLQDKLRVAAKDVGGVAGVALPDVVKPENPFFAVFQKIADWKNVGFKEIFIVMVGFLLDLGDIIGYSMIPNRKPKSKMARPDYRPEPEFIGPERIVAQARAARRAQLDDVIEDFSRPRIAEPNLEQDPRLSPVADPLETDPISPDAPSPARKPRPFRFGRR